MRGDLPLATPVAERLVALLAKEWGVEAQPVRQPGELSALAEDLRTYSMFAPGKIVVAIATGALADRDTAAELMKDVLKAKLRGEGELDSGSRAAALRLLQVLRLHDLDPASDAPEAVLGKLPAALFGARKGGAAEETRASLAPLLAAAIEAGLTGIGAGEESILADLVHEGLPERHLLVLVESAVADAHPLVAALARRDAIVDAGRLEAQKGGGIAGLDRLYGELERETGAKIDREARALLARRTLKPEDVRRGGEAGAMDPDSISRLSAEFRKLASLASGTIGEALVEENVDDRGQEEVWPILDAVGEGNAAAALAAIGRRLRGADDPLAERLSLFALLSGFGRQMVQVHGLVAATGARPAVESYPRFKDTVAPTLKGKVEGIAANPFARMHEFRLHRLYLAATRRDARRLARLPWRLLETERRLKGDADDPDAALTLLVIELSALGAAGSAPAGRGRLR